MVWLGTRLNEKLWHANLVLLWTPALGLWIIAFEWTKCLLYCTRILILSIAYQAHELLRRFKIDWDLYRWKRNALESQKWFVSKQTGTFLSLFTKVFTIHLINTLLRCAARNSTQSGSRGKQLPSVRQARCVHARAGSLTPSHVSKSGAEVSGTKSGENARKSAGSEPVAVATACKVCRWVNGFWAKNKESNSAF